MQTNYIQASSSDPLPPREIILQWPNRFQVSFILYKETVLMLYMHYFITHDRTILYEKI